MKVKRKKRAKDEVNGQGGKGGAPAPHGACKSSEIREKRKIATTTTIHMQRSVKYFEPRNLHLDLSPTAASSTAYQKVQFLACFFAGVYTCMPYSMTYVFAEVFTRSYMYVVHVRRTRTPYMYRSVNTAFVGKIRI